MSNVIAFLESLGRDPQLVAGSDEFAEAVAALPVDDDARAALLAGDADALNGLLGGRLRMMCLLFPADGEEPQKDDDAPSDDQPDEQKEQIRRGTH